MAELWDIVDAKGQKTGKVHRRGEPMEDGAYHLSVSVWITNARGQYLISRRVAAKPPAPGMWETTGGSAIAGENGLQAALRETKEELGIELDPAKGEIFCEYPWPHSSGSGGCYVVVWVFRQEVDLASVKLQEEETCGVKWASRDEIREFIRRGLFINYTYLEELFTATEC